MKVVRKRRIGGNSVAAAGDAALAVPFGIEEKLEAVVIVAGAAIL